MGAAILVGEGFLACYAALMAFVMTGWMIDDALAFRLPDGGWIGIAVERGLVWAVIALAFWAGVVFANRWLMPRLGLDLRRQSFWLGLAGAACIIGSSAAGAIHFVAEKPFM